MRHLQGLEEIDWNALGDPELPDLIRDFIEGRSAEEQKFLLEQIWDTIVPDRHYLTETTSYVVEFLVPLLQDEKRGDESLIVVYLAQACWAAMESLELYHDPDFDAAQWRSATLQAVEEGFEALLRIFHRRAELRVAIASILTCFPERARPHLAQIVSLYDASGKQFEKSELLLSLDRVRGRHFQLGRNAVGGDRRRGRSRAATSRPASTWPAMGQRARSLRGPFSLRPRPTKCPPTSSS
jgi:hypothetical protein